MPSAPRLAAARTLFASAIAGLVFFATLPAEAGLIGKRAPPLAGVDMQQQPVDIAGLRGRTVLVMFWATWCVPCRKEMPLVQAAYEKYRSRGFAVIAVNVGDDAADVSAFTTRYRVAFPVLLDRNGNTAERFQVIGLPTNYVIDTDGIVREEILGSDLSDERLESLLRGLVTAQ